MAYIIDGGCLSKDTNILMADGCIKRICNLQIGDLLQVTKGITRVNNIWRGYEEEMLVLKTYDKKITLTKGHPVLLNDGTWARAMNIKEGDILQTREGNDKVISIITLNEPSEVYNIDIENEDTGFFAEGIVVGDFRRQNMII